MPRKLSMLALVVSIITQTYVNAADKDVGLDDIVEPSSKKAKQETEGKEEDKFQLSVNRGEKIIGSLPYAAVDTSLSSTVNTSLEIPTVAFDLTSEYRKDVVVELNLSSNQHLTDISFVLGFPDLVDLNLFRCLNLKNNYRQAAQLKKLQKLNLAVTSFTELGPIREFKSLTYLDISYCQLTEIVKHLIPLTKLKILILAHSDKVEDLEKLAELKSLQTLSLSSTIYSPVYKSIDFLSQVTGLLDLDLSRNDYIQYIKPLISLPKLTSLNLMSCRNIEDWENIKYIKKLEIINISYLGFSSDYLEYFKHLKKIIKD